MNERLLRKFIGLVLEQASSATTRAAKSKSAIPAAKVIFKNAQPPNTWTQKSAAKVGSNSIDLVVTNGTDDVNIEVKHYPTNTQFKAEISLAKGDLRNLLGLSKQSFVAQETILDRILEPTSAEIQSDPELENKADLETKIKAVIEEKGTSAVTVGKGIVNSQGKRLNRFIRIMKGDEDDYMRVRHASGPTSSPRYLYTAPTSAVRSSSSVTEGDMSSQILNKLAIDIAADFGDDYLALWDGGSLRVFSLSGSDLLQIGAPSFTGSNIASWKFATHGGGTRPSVKIEVNGGKILS